MSILHQQFTEFNTIIKLNDKKLKSLMKSRRELRRKIRSWFKENKPNELQPKFNSQGSLMMGTSINPIIEFENGNRIENYDLDDGVYFIEKIGEDNRPNIDTLHSCLFEAVDTHTTKNTIQKTTCIRVVFADGHHIDLPIYYKNNDKIELAHRSKGYIVSDPKAFYEWFNTNKCAQLERIVRYLKAWKNFRELENTNLKFPSGFELTILATNCYVEKPNDDEAFRETLEAIYNFLNSSFECYRPTIPTSENLFENYSNTRKNNFMNNLKSLIDACEAAKSEQNQKNATEHIRKQFGDRFPLGQDISDAHKSSVIITKLKDAPIPPKPYCQ